MTRSVDFRTILVALAFAAIGFFVAERMAPAQAAPQQAAAAHEGAASFAGTTGALTFFDGKQWWLVIVRDERVWKVMLNDRQSPSRPWSELATQ